MILKSELINKVMEKAESLLYKPVQEVLVIDIGDKLSLINIDLTAGIKVTALNTINPAEFNNFIQQNKIQHKNVIVTLPLDVFFVKRLRLPVLSDKELSETIKWELKPEVPFDLTQAVISYEVLQQTIASDGVSALDCLCIAAPKEKLIKRIQFLREAGFSCLRIVPQAIGYAKIINRYFVIDKDTLTGLLYIDDHSCWFCINKDGKLEFYRGLPFSLNKLRESFEITPPPDQLISLARLEFERLTGEIRRSLLYFYTQFSDKHTIAKVFIAGKAQNIPGLDTFLSKDISLEVNKFSLAGKLDKVSSISEEAVSELAGSIGAAIGYEEGINLLPRELRIAKHVKLHRKLFQYIGFFSLVSIMLFYLFVRIGTSVYEKRLNYASFQLKMVSDIQRTKLKVEELSAFIKETGMSSGHLVALLKGLSISSPKELFLNSLSFNADTKIMEINGFVNNSNVQAETLLRNFIRDMRSISSIRDANISSVEKAKLGEQDILKFNITFKAI